MIEKVRSIAIDTFLAKWINNLRVAAAYSVRSTMRQDGRRESQAEEASHDRTVARGDAVLYQSRPESNSLEVLSGSRKAECGITVRVDNGASVEQAGTIARGWTGGELINAN
jgi:hypothetical protein